MNIPDHVAVWVTYWDNGWRHGRLLDIGEHRARVLNTVYGPATVKVDDLWTIQKEMEIRYVEKNKAVKEVEAKETKPKAAKKTLSGQKSTKTLPEKQKARREKHEKERYAGKRIKVLNKNHGAREGTARAKWLDAIIASKT